MRAAVRSPRESHMAQFGMPLDEMAVVHEHLTPQEQEVVVATFIQILDGLYVHLPLKRAMHGIDPVQQLRRLLDRVRVGLDDATFHAEMARIITSIRDAHTTYIGPSNLQGYVAALPFLIEEFAEDGRRRYLVSKLVEGAVDDAGFAEGVEVTTWNGAPIDAAVARRAEQERGGRPDSARARALESLTLRPLRFGPPPDELWVVVGYADERGDHEVRIPWRVIVPKEAEPPAHPTAPQSMAEAIHPDRRELRRAKKAMFNHELWRGELATAVAPVEFGDPRDGWISGRFQDAVSARSVPTSHGEFGYLRLWSFDVADDTAYIDEVVEMLRLLPGDGLIIDLRGNPGGLIWAAERLLQLFTPGHVEPTRFSLVATDLTRAMARARRNERLLSPWQRSLVDAVATGELYSQAVPITPVDRCNDIGQVYGGPVVAVVDATSYSAADLFAAGFVDNTIGTLLSVGDATGAGGANVWRSDTVAVALTETSEHAMAPLPAGIAFTVSVRRATRIGAAAGSPIEDVGVAGHRRYQMTRDDLGHGNVDLLEACGALLSAEPTTALEIAWSPPTLSVTTSRIDRVDVYADGRPFTTLDVLDDGTITVDLPDPELIRVEGYRGQNLRQSRLYDNSRATG
jgi:C-terminal processing protease CtpA/Prc